MSRRAAATSDNKKEAGTPQPSAKRSRPVSPAKPSIRRKPKPAPKPKRRHISLQEFDQLDLGMSYKEVVKVLGRPGKEDSRMELLGTTTTTYEWKEGLGRMVFLTFEDDKLSSRMQFGLPAK